MKNKLKAFFALLWSITTDIPGWPDAPRRVRIRRLIPTALPVVAMLLIFLWNLVWRTPHIMAERKSSAPVVALEAEVTNLRLAYSEQQAAEITARAEEEGRILLSTPAQLPNALEALKKKATTFAWEATFISAPWPDLPDDKEAQIYFLPARGKMVPTADNEEPFISLIAFMEKISAFSQWIDVTRLTVRADDRGKLSVETHFRFGCRVPHEKTP